MIKGAKAGNKKPVREAVSAISRQTMSILYGITEGEALMFGVAPTTADIKKRIFLDGTPIMSESGDTLLDVEVDYRTGTIDQTAITGVKAATITDSVGVEVKHAVPVTRTYNTEGINTYEVMLNVGQLFSNTDSGDSRKASLSFVIEVSVNGGSFVAAITDTITERIVNGFTPMYTIRITQDGTHTIRVRKLTEDAANENNANSLYVASIAQVYEANFAYPTTALLWLRFNAEQFRNVPKLELRFFGKSDLLIPANYNAATREYYTTGAGTTNGVWNGIFTRGYTDNPVWVWLDILVSKRYGLGNRISLDMINKWELYKIAKWCDELVPDGKGGFEPRITCNNLYLNTSEDAFRVINDISTIFRAATVFDGKYLYPKADMPRDVVHTFALASLVDLNYSSVAASAIHNVCHASYYDKDKNFTRATATKSRRQAIAAMGRIEPLDLPTIGCSSLGQAQRAAEYALLSEATETNLVSFTCSLDGVAVQVGDLFILHDSFMDGRLSSGRAVAINANIVTIDRELDFTPDADATLTLNVLNGSATLFVLEIVGRDVYLSTIKGDNSGSDDAATVLAEALTSTVWVLRDTSTTNKSIYTALESKFNKDDNTWSISGVAYNIDKNAIVDQAALGYDDAPTPNKNKILPPPAVLTATYRSYTEQSTMYNDIDVNWSFVSGASFYELEQQDELSNWRIVASTPDVSFTIKYAAIGDYEFRVRAVDSFGIRSNYTVAYPIYVAGKTIPPDTVQNIDLVGRTTDIWASWEFGNNSADVAATLIDYTDDIVAGVINKMRVAFPSDTAAIPVMNNSETMFIRFAVIDKSGLISSYTTWRTQTAASDEIIDSLTGKITRAHLSDSLKSELDTYRVFSGTSNVDDMTAGALQRKTYLYATSATDILGDAPFDGIIEWIGLGLDRGMQIAIDKTGRVYSRKWEAGVPASDWTAISG